MRHNGQRFTTDLEPGTTVNGIQNKRDPTNGNVLEYSKIRYTRDEFPPTTWLEGGNGDGSSTAQTLCAAMRCGKGENGVKIKAEQDCRPFCVSFPKIFKSVIADRPGN
jgi:hypothetical protein